MNNKIPDQFKGGPLFRLRCWLIKRLVGDAVVVMNARISFDVEIRNNLTVGNVGTAIITGDSFTLGTVIERAEK